ncbi:MAG: hypothetical protein HIU83_14215 [Proteobacteria bacterium]|nr:hypothetical protein [Pseudomonadota bacterium]
MSNNQSFEIKSVDSSLSSYVVDFGYMSAYYMCYSLGSDINFSHVFPNSVIEKIDKHLNNKIWVKDNISSLCADTYSCKQITINKSAEATIESKEIGYKNPENSTDRVFYYNISFLSGSKAYISVTNFDESLSNGNIVEDRKEIAKLKAMSDEEEQVRAEAARVEEARRTEEARVEAEQKEKELAQKKETERLQLLKEQSDIVATLKKGGIYRGKALWLKYPKFGMTGLTQIKITDIVLETKEEGSPGYTYTSKYIILKVDCDDYNVSELKYDNNLEEILEDYHQKNIGAKWGKRALAEIEKGNVFIGMTKAQVIAGWGRPGDINRTAGSWGVHEQWVYGSNYLYFENGTLKSWQD